MRRAAGTASFSSCSLLPPIGAPRISFAIDLVPTMMIAATHYVRLTARRASFRFAPILAVSAAGCCAHNQTFVQQAGSGCSRPVSKLAR
jgi:hypothetical protein